MADKIYYSDIARYLDHKACEMKCELNKLASKQNGGSSYEATLSENYDFLCNLIYELNEKFDN